MVLRNVLDKFRSPRQPREGSEPEKKSSKQDGARGAAGDSKKKLKKIRSVRVADLDGLRKGKAPSSKATSESPNYMKPTTCYDSRKDKPQVTPVSSTSTKVTKSVKNPIKDPISSKPISSSRVAHGIKPAARVLVKNPSLKRPWRSSTKKSSGMNVSRSTCSSTIKDSKIPEVVGVDEPDGASALNACLYSYCSLHSHGHGAVPVLKRYLSRRVSLKAQKSMKVVGHSSGKADEEIEFVEDVVNDFFNEVHSKLQTQSMQQEGREERSGDDVGIDSIVSKVNEMISEDHHDVNQLQESCSVTSFEEDYGDENIELSVEEMEVLNQFLEYLENGWDKDIHLETAESVSAALCSDSYKDFSEGLDDQTSDSISESRIYPEDDGRPESNLGFLHEEEYSLSGHGGLQSYSAPSYSPQASGQLDEHKDDDKPNLISFGCEEQDRDSNVVYFESHKDQVYNIPKAKYRKMSRKSSESIEAGKEFNPRPPRFLSLQTEPEPEKVNLKHQRVEEKKAAEEWMIDYAVRKALRRLASARKKKVALLVAAFETVKPQLCEKLLSYEGSGCTDGRPEQICSCS